MPGDIKFSVDNLELGGNLFLIAGPCVIESEAHALKMAEEIGEIARKLQIPYIFKASYDKANRTSLHSFRGPGLEEGLRILKSIGKEAGVPLLTDVHEAKDVPVVAEAVDVDDQQATWRARCRGRPASLRRASSAQTAAPGPVP